MKISRHYDIRELVPPETWKKWGTSSRWFIREETIDVLELLHTKVQLEYRLDSDNVRVVINNWHYQKSGYIYKYSGYRPPTAYVNDEILKKNPNSESLHRQGNGMDVKISIRNDGVWRKLSTTRVHNIIKKYTHEFISAGLTTLEKIKMTPTWTHFDCRNTGQSSIRYVG